MIFVNHIKQITKKLLFVLFSLNLLLATQETYINTGRVIPNMKLLHRVVDPLEILPIKRNHIYRKNKLNFHKSKTFSLLISNNNWNKDFINSVNKFLLKNIKPNFTFLNLVSKKNMKLRLSRRKKNNRYDKFKSKFYSRVQSGFIKIANKNKKKYLKIN